MSRWLTPLFAALVLGGCASLWGFDDLTPGLLGGDGGVVPMNDSGTPCFPSDIECSTNHVCGTIRNRCGTLTDCGPPCYAGASCRTNGTQNVCGPGTCAPSCVTKACGESDGCGGICSQGTCPTGQHCSTGTCVDNAVCSIGAACPAVDCAGCSLYCSAEGVCCVTGACTANAQCCPGTVCHHSDRYAVEGRCQQPSATDRCANDTECNRPGMTTERCQGGACCHPVVGTSCYVNAVDPECCEGLVCQVKTISDSQGACCVPMHGMCSAATDCCAIHGTTCQAGTCCIASGAPGCNSNADCCAGSPGCVAGSCQ